MKLDRPGHITCVVAPLRIESGGGFRLAVAAVIIEAMTALSLYHPMLTPATRRELAVARAQLAGWKRGAS